MDVFWKCAFVSSLSLVPELILKMFETKKKNHEAKLM